MNRPQKIIFSVTNDLTYDQRMIRICSTLAHAGYLVTLAGRHLPTSLPLTPQPYHQKRINCLFTKGVLFYAEFNIRLLLYLLLMKADVLGAVDLDTIIPTYLVSRLKGTKRVYDAHELFSEMKEVVTRPTVHRFWKAIEKTFVPRFPFGYTVNSFILSDLKKMYGVDYAVIRNLPASIGNLAAQKEVISVPFADKNKKLVIYQGAVNEGRCFESLIPAMKLIDANLVICGDGNFMQHAKDLTLKYDMSYKIYFTGWVTPQQLIQYTLSADVGVNVIENNGRNNSFSLSNRFFDYIQCALPQVSVDYPPYKEINDQYQCALLINNTDSQSIADGINTLLSNEVLHEQLKRNCLAARTHLTWNNEAHKLTAFYQKVFQGER